MKIAAIRIPAVVLWILLGLAIALAPVACGGDDDGGDTGGIKADAMTPS